MGIYTRSKINESVIKIELPLNDELKHVPVDDINSEDLDYSEDKAEEAKQWMDKSLLAIVYPQKNIDDLELLWIKWNEMPYKKRKDSDMKCTELYGMTNTELYEKNKSLIAKIDNVEKEVTDDDVAVDTMFESVVSLMTGVINESSNNRQLQNNGCRRRETLPMFTHEEVVKLGNKYGVADMNIKNWKLLYEHQCMGLLSEDGDAEISRIWLEHMRHAYSNIHELKGVDLNNRKQSILELGWDPKVEFTMENVVIYTDRINNVLKEEFTVDVKDLTKLKVVDMIEESTKNDITKNPVYIVLLKSDSLFGKVINKITNSTYSHAAIGVESDLSRLYSFNLDKGGFAIESLKSYINQNNKSELAVYTVFLDDGSMRNLRLNLDGYLNNRDSTAYGVKNLINIMRQKTVKLDNTLVCSQFVDTILKDSGKDVTGKHSSLVIPKDFYKNKKLYKIYEGKSVDYSEEDIERMLRPIIRSGKVRPYKITNENSFIEALGKKDISLHDLVALDKVKHVLSENSMKIYNEYVSGYVNEYKQTPVKFNQDGDLIFHVNKDLNYEDEYNKAHKLLNIYSKDGNVDGMKYEIARLWGVSNKIMEDVGNGGDKSLYKTRARVLNDFNKYLREVQKHEPLFNFIEYFETTPFYNKGVIVNKHTLKHGVDLAGNLAKLLIRKY